MPLIERDVVIIGAGTAGLSAERSARAAGTSTLLIDDRFAGTTCATVGCMPSKLLVAAAEAAEAVRQAPTFGIEPGGLTVNGAAVFALVRRERDRFAGSVRRPFDELPEGVMVRATARFTSPTTLSLDNGSSVVARRSSSPPDSRRR